MWNNTRDLIQNSFNNFGSIFRRDRSNNSIDLDFRRNRSTIRRPRRTNRTNCLSRNSTRASTINSQLNREFNVLSSSSSNNQIIRPPHIHRTRSSHSTSSSLSSPSSQHSFAQPLLPANETINSNQTSNSLSSPLPPPSTRSLSPLLPLVNSRYPIISCPPSSVFNQQQHYLRSISRGFCSSNGEHHNLIQLTKERNYLSCLINLLVIITIVVAILQPKWFSIQGGVCNNRYIGLQEFMYLQNSPSSSSQPSIKSSVLFSNINNDQKHTATDKPKINYFKLSDEIFKTNSSTSLDSLSSSNNNQTHLNLLTKLNQTSSIGSQSAFITTQSPIYPIHLPTPQSVSSMKSTSSLYRSYEKLRKSNDETSQIQFYKSLADHYQNQLNGCLSNEVLGLQKLIIVLCVFVVLTSLIQLLLDLIKTSNKYMNLLRERCIFNLISVIICIMIIGITYLLSNLLTKEQMQKHLMNNPNRLYYSNYPNHHYLDKNKLHSPVNYYNLDKDDGHVEVRLEISYYLIIFAGVFSLVAALINCNIFNKPNLYLININHDQEANSLLNDDPHQASHYWSHLFNVNNANSFRNLVLNSPYYFEPPPVYSER